MSNFIVDLLLPPKSVRWSSNLRLLQSLINLLLPIAILPLLNFSDLEADS